MSRGLRKRPPNFVFGAALLAMVLVSASCLAQTEEVFSWRDGEGNLIQSQFRREPGILGLLPGRDCQGQLGTERLLVVIQSSEAAPLATSHRYFDDFADLGVILVEGEASRADALLSHLNSALPCSVRAVELIQPLAEDARWPHLPLLDPHEVLIAAEVDDEGSFRNPRISRILSAVRRPFDTNTDDCPFKKVTLVEIAYKHSSLTIASLLNEITNRGPIASPNFIFFAASPVPLSVEQGDSTAWHLRSIGAPVDLGTIGDDPQTGPMIAVVDSEFNPSLDPHSSHLDQTGSDCDEPGTDNDGNGLTDDCYGWFFGWNYYGLSQSTLSLMSPPPGMTGPGSHGNSVAALVVQVCPNCSLLLIAVPSLSNTADLACAIQYVESRRPGVMVMSWGWDPILERPLIRSLLEDLADSGVPQVYAAGNSTDGANGAVYRPARYPFTISVGASDRNDQERCYSHSQCSTGPDCPDVLAPGGATSLCTPELPDSIKYPGTNLNVAGGTSNSAPIAAGVAGLMLSVNSTLDPESVKAILISTSDAAICNLTPLEECTTGPGRINAVAAVEASNP